VDPFWVVPLIEKSSAIRPISGNILEKLSQGLRGAKHEMLLLSQCDLPEELMNKEFMRKLNEIIVPPILAPLDAKHTSIFFRKSAIGEFYAINFDSEFLDETKWPSFGLEEGIYIAKKCDHTLDNTISSILERIRWEEVIVDDFVSLFSWDETFLQKQMIQKYLSSLLDENQLPKVKELIVAFDSKIKNESTDDLLSYFSVWGDWQQTVVDFLSPNRIVEVLEFLGESNLAPEGGFFFLRGVRNRIKSNGDISLLKKVNGMIKETMSSIPPSKRFIYWRMMFLDNKDKDDAFISSLSDQDIVKYYLQDTEKAKYHWRNIFNHWGLNEIFLRLVSNMQQYLLEGLTSAKSIMLPPEDIENMKQALSRDLLSLNEELAFNDEKKKQTKCCVDKMMEIMDSMKNMFGDEEIKSLGKLVNEITDLLRKPGKALPRENFDQLDKLNKMIQSQLSFKRDDIKITGRVLNSLIESISTSNEIALDDDDVEIMERVLSIKKELICEKIRDMLGNMATSTDIVIEQILPASLFTNEVLSSEIKEMIEEMAKHIEDEKRDFFRLNFPRRSITNVFVSFVFTNKKHVIEPCLNGKMIEKIIRGMIGQKVRSIINREGEQQSSAT
jgi:hypothetical protein